MTNKQNDSDMKLTVIIVTYNQVDSIADTIESVVSQKINFKYTIFLCDDCSTDGTTEICQSYADKFPELIQFFPQENNTFYDKPENNHVVKAYRRIKTPYFCLIEGDDSYCDIDFLQIAVTTLDENNKYYIFGANTLVKNHIKNTEYTSINDDTLKEYYLDQVSLGPLTFIYSQSRVYRNTFTSFPQGDMLMYLYHLAFGPLYYYNKVVAIYNITGKGVWTSLPPLVPEKTQDIIPYRMCQALNYDYEDRWLAFLSHKSLRRIGFLKRFLRTRRTWHLWFYFSYVPTFGIEILDVNYGNLKRKPKQNYFNNFRILLRLFFKGE